MRENLTRQSLPSYSYYKYLGAALCVFNQNNSFIIEMILENIEETGIKLKNGTTPTWYDFMEGTSGVFKSAIHETITKKSDSTIEDLFYESVGMRDRIVHSF